MECPKCGSEIVYKSTSTHYHYGCEKCDYKLPYEKEKEHLEQVKQEKHQQRLDNVLSKMGKVSDDESVYRKNDDYTDYWFTHSKERKQFFFGTTDQVISLDTVESLIKDLEEE